MARILSPRMLSSSSPPCLFSPSIYNPKPQLAPKPVSAKSVSFVSDSAWCRRQIVLTRASSAAAVSSVVSDDIASVLGEINILTAAGEPVRFKDLWDQEEGIAVVALLRHFGCICCWEFATALRDVKEKFDSIGVKLVAVGVGTPDKAQILAQRLPFPMDSLYADPERKAYDVLGLYFGIGRTFFNPASVKVFSRGESIKEASRNYTIKATPEDVRSVLQQGGMFVFKGKKLLYARKDEGTGDHAPLEDVFDICTKAAVA